MKAPHPLTRSAVARRRRRSGQTLVEYSLVSATMCAYLALVIWGVPLPGGVAVPGLYDMTLKVFGRINHVLLYPMGGDPAGSAS